MSRRSRNVEQTQVRERGAVDLVFGFTSLIFCDLRFSIPFFPSISFPFFFKFESEELGNAMEATVCFRVEFIALTLRELCDVKQDITFYVI